MFQRFLTRRRCRRGPILAGMLAVAVLLATWHAIGAEEFLKKSFITPGDPKPIFLNADYISTWTEGSERIFLLRGKVWIEQGLVKLTMPQSVVWVDEAAKKNSGIYYLEVYGEGGVVVTERAQQTNAGRALLNFATRGEVRIKARVNKVLQVPMPEDAVFKRAQAERQVSRQASSSSVQPADLKVPQPPPSPPTAPNLGPAAVPPLPWKSDAGLKNEAGKLTSISTAAQAGELPPPPPSLGMQPIWQAGSPAIGPLPGNAPAPASIPPPVVAPGNPPALPNVPLSPPANSGPTPSNVKPVSFNATETPASAVAQTAAGATGPAPNGSAQVFPTPGLVPNDPAPSPNTPTFPVPPAGLPPPVPPSAPGTPPPWPPPGPYPGPGPILQPGPQPPPAPDFPTPAPERKISILPGSDQDIQFKIEPLPNGETAYVVTTRVIITVSNPTDKFGFVDMEADRVVVWSKGDTQELFSKMRGAGETKSSKEIEFYLSGNVEMRNKTKKETQILRADEVYYNVGRNVALALRGDLEVQQPRLPYPFHVKADELVELSPKKFQASRAAVFSSSLQSDPGIQIMVSDATLEEIETPRRNIFGFAIKDIKTGEPLKENQRIFTGRNMILRYEGIPIFYFPYIQGDVEDPLGPLDNLAFNYNKIFGFQLFTTLNVYDMIGFTPVPGTKWQMDLDYLSARGPAMGMEYNFAGRNMFFGVPGRYEGLVKAYGIYDTGTDILGGNRGTQVVVTPALTLPLTHPDWRGRVFSRLNVQELPYAFSVQGQLSAISDKNYLEQFFNYEYNNDLNEQSFLYVKQAPDDSNWAWTVLGEQRLRNWVTETSWLPKADGYLLGQKFVDLVTYNAHADAGFGRLQPAHVPPPAYLPTDVFVNTGRFDLWQDVGVPFNLGAFKLVPYLVGDLTYYTEDVTKNGRGRIYAGGGLRGSLPLSRLYDGVQSEFFNVNGIYHKIVISANYYNVHSDTSLNQLPQLDRLNDDVSDLALRDLFPRQVTLNPANAAFLTGSNLFNPQFYALRRLLDNRVDTLDTIEVIQADIRQRWQTRRGFPGNQHVIDWMTLDLGASIYPHSNRDNFGELFGILQYDWTWNIGDSTSLVSSGWLDPIGGGPRVFNFGGNVSRPDRTNLFLGYRQIDPLNSKAVVASVAYALSAKYALTGSTMYDFGVNSQVNSLSITRIGTDLQVSLGFSYNSILNNFGVTFAIVPNLLPVNHGTLGASPGGALGGGMRK